MTWNVEEGVTPRSDGLIAILEVDFDPEDFVYIGGLKLFRRKKRSELKMPCTHLNVHGIFLLNDP
jgi:hypothetical protein